MPSPLPAAPPELVLAIPAEVLRQRPDVQAAEQQLLAATARVEQTDAGRLPSLQLGGSIGLNALSLGALGSGAGVASLLASVSVPLFDAGRLQAQVRQQEAARDEAAAGYRATVLAALQEVEDALVSLNATREQLSAQQAAATFRPRCRHAGRPALPQRPGRFPERAADPAHPAAGRRQPGRHHHHAGHRPRAPVQGAGRRLDPDSRRRSNAMSTPDPAPTPPAVPARPRRRAAPLVAPPHALGRAGAAGGRRRRHLVLARPAPGRSGAAVHHAGGDARRAHRHRHRQRHAAADHPGGHRQRALGHRVARACRRQRPREEGPGAGGTGRRPPARPGHRARAPRWRPPRPS